VIVFEELAFKKAGTYCGEELVTIPLDNQGAVYIGGKNGAGKSFTWNVLHNILFGYTPLSAKGKRKLIANDNYYGHVKFKYNNDRYTIKQFFDNKDFINDRWTGNGYDIIKNGKSLEIAGGILECEKYIANLLPFTAEEFCGFYYLSQDSLHVLASGKGSERLAYLSKVFGFDIYDKIRADVKVKLDELDEKLTEVVRVQEEVEKLYIRLEKFPSLDLLKRRLAIAEEHLIKPRIKKTIL